MTNSQSPDVEEALLKTLKDTSHPITMYDRVRIKSTHLTREKKIDGVVCVVYGFTTPSNPQNRQAVGEIIGEGSLEDRAYMVHIEEIDQSIWIAPYLLEVVDHNPNVEVTIGSKRLVRLASGEWKELPPLGLWQKILSLLGITK